jgi:hypothetical protein
MTANFYDAACDYPNETFEKITRRMLGAAGFLGARNRKLYEKECKKAFNLARYDPYRYSQFHRHLLARSLLISLSQLHPFDIFSTGT